MGVHLMGVPQGRGPYRRISHGRTFHGYTPHRRAPYTIRHMPMCKMRVYGGIRCRGCTSKRLHVQEAYVYKVQLVCGYILLIGAKLLPNMIYIVSNPV